MRKDNDDYFEAVFKTQSLSQIACMLEAALGPPRKEHEKISKDADAAIKKIGGLRRGQTLHLLDKEGYLIFAMLWPWQDGERITLKVVKIK